VCLYSVPLIIMEAELLDVQHKMEKQDVASWGVIRPFAVPCVVTYSVHSPAVLGQG
jgi:hypothetical protein